MTSLSRAEEQVNLARYRPGQRQGHYESFFQRANHPTRPLAFWVRYTLFSPRGRPEAAIGELWAVFFDGETGKSTVVKREVPIGRCTFARDRFAVAIEGATLGPGAMKGEASQDGGTIAWDVRYDSTERPLFLFPLALYDAPLPKAKSLVGVPMARYAGQFVVDGRAVDVTGWVGSQNHNWGTKHTDLYAWAQVAGFDNDPDAFLEVATARLKIAGLWTPFMTPIVLRHGGRELAMRSVVQAIRAKGSFTYFDMHFHAEDDEAVIEGRVRAPKEAFVGLRYYNPPGGEKHCLNTKIAACDLTVTYKRRGRETFRLATASRSAFEILTDDRGHGVPLRA